MRAPFLLVGLVVLGLASCGDATKPAGSGGSSGAAGSGGTDTGGAGGTAGNGGTGTAGNGGNGTAGNGGNGTGGSGGSGVTNAELCAAYCANPATASACAGPGYSCEAFCMTFAAGACPAWHTAFECLVANGESFCPGGPGPNQCGMEINAAALCEQSVFNVCAAYCDKATDVPGCVADTCYQTCVTNTAQSAMCSGAYAAYYNCLAQAGTTPTCTGIEVPPACAAAETNLNTCTGMGGSGGGGGMGGGGMGGMGGAGGSGGSGGMGGCPTPVDPTVLGCSVPDGNIKVSGSTPMVAVTFGATMAPASCTAANSKLYPVQNGQVNIGVPFQQGCLLHRVCNWDPACSTDYSAGKVVSRCFNGVSVTCTVP